MKIALRILRLARFNLRTLLIFVTAVAVWLAWYDHRAKTQLAAVAALQKAGAFTYYDYQMASEPEYAEYFHWYSEPPSSVPDWLRRQIGDDYFSSVIGVQFWAPETDRYDASDVNALKSLPNLRKLIVYGRRFTDADLNELHCLSGLTHLWLSRTSVTEDGIARFQKAVPGCKVER